MPSKPSRPILRHYDPPVTSSHPSTALYYDLRWAAYVMEIHAHRREARIRTFGQPTSPSWTRFVSSDSARALTQYANVTGYAVVDGPLFDEDTTILPHGSTHSDLGHTPTVGEAFLAALQQKG